MKNYLSNVLKIFLIILTFILVGLLIVGLSLFLGWPWWVGCFILLGLIGLYIGFLFMRKIWSRNREKHFVQQVIEQDEYRLKALKGKERDDLNALQNKWKESIEALKRSHLRKQGNPLYVLPWYIIIGESGSGKTTSINSARLSSPFAEVSRTSGISGTKNCDWWFFEQAIILDTAGRWTIPVDEGKDKEEWGKFLNLLSKYRKREPLNGIIVTMAADKLLEAQPEVLEDDGRNIRLRIDELMRTLGFKFPIYLLITKCDLVQGMTEFCDQLPEDGLAQPMGLINHDMTTDVDDFQERAISTIVERLRNIRLLLLHQPENKETDPALLLFPEEFKNIKKGLGPFVKGAFWENPYQETSILRGIFFSSGRQEGSPFSHFLNTLGLIGEKEILPGTSKGLFLHDFFSKILPKDRGLFAPTKRTIEWSALTRNLGLTSWFILCVAFCGLLSFSFVKNMKIIRDVPHEFTRHTIFKEEPVSDIEKMNSLRETIIRMEEQNRDWLFPRFKMNESIKVEFKLKAKYCRMLKSQFLEFIDDEERDRDIVLNLFHLGPKNYGFNITHLVDRINILQARLESKELLPNELLEKLKKIDQPFVVPTKFFDVLEEKPAVREQFSTIYLYYLVWGGKDDATLNDLNKEMLHQQKLLVEILKRKDLNWIVDWVNSTFPEKITLAEFWNGSIPVSTGSDIPYSYTVEGKEKIDASLNEIIEVTRNKLNVEDMVDSFKSKYRNDYVKAWYNFGEVFPTGAGSLDGKEEWKQIAIMIEREHGPYLTLLDRMANELQPIRGNIPNMMRFNTKGVMDEWIKYVYRLESAKKYQATNIDVTSKGGFIPKIINKGKRIFDKTSEKTGKFSAESILGTKQKEVEANAFSEYRNALSQIASNSSTSSSTSQRKAFDMMSKAFSEDPSISEPALIWIAENAIDDLKASMSGTNSELKMFWRLVNGPFDLMKTYVVNETACYLQKAWERNVQREVDWLNDIQQLSQGRKFAIKFVKEGEASPFVKWGRHKKYYPKEKFNKEIPFTEDFLAFLTSSSSGGKNIIIGEGPPANYYVNIMGIPTDNSFGINISKTELILICPNGREQTLNFENYPKEESFNWSHNECTDVLLNIDVSAGREKVRLEKHYKGDLSFPEFLKDFYPRGVHTFRPDDFSNYRDLDRLGINNIKVTYKFTGHLKLLEWYDEYLRIIRTPIPESIVKCWDK